MIELKGDRLFFSFPEVFSDASLCISLFRTLRIPDDGKSYPLPAGLGLFPIRHVDDYGDSVPAEWRSRGGVMMPMYQSEAMWIGFSAGYISDRFTQYPFAVKIATGKINAVSGKQWRNGLRKGRQNYMVVPGQPWLDGYVVEEDLIRQFVAMPLGEGYTAEEQLTGKAEFGGLQICVYPMKVEVFEEMFPVRKSDGIERQCLMEPCEAGAAPSMGLAPGGLMKQQIYRDRFGVDVWDEENGSRCFVHLANTLLWTAITGENPPHEPITAKNYRKYRIPWFDYYNDSLSSLQGSEELRKLKSVIQMSREKGRIPLKDHEVSDPVKVIDLSPKKRPVREFI